MHTLTLRAHFAAIFCAFGLLPSLSPGGHLAVVPAPWPTGEPKESKPWDADTYISLYLHILLYGTAGSQKGAGMGHHPDTAHVSSMNYKDEKLIV